MRNARKNNNIDLDKSTMQRRNGSNNKRKRSEVKSSKKIILNVIILAALIIFIYCTFELIYWFKNNKHSKNITKELTETVEVAKTPGNVVEMVNPPTDTTSNYYSDYFYYMSFPFVSVDFEYLNKKNEDTVAWINVPGTSVNYPVVQANDNSYYLAHAFDKSKNAAGWIFADYRCNLQEFGRNTIIYGHNRRNVTMFGSLPNTLNSSWYGNRDNTIIYLSTPKYNTIWQVFSVYQIEKESGYLTTYFNDDDVYLSFLNKMKDRSIYNFNTELSSKDRIITLSTCAKNDKDRVVVQAKLIKKEIK